MPGYDAVAGQDYGYVPGIYVGAAAILDPDQLHEDLKFQYYWKSYSDVPEVSVRGYCMDQAGSANGLVWSGVSYDIDFLQKDNVDNTPFWLVTLPPAATMTAGLMRGTDPGAIGIPTAF
jgi:hypothetical protein